MIKCDTFTYKGINLKDFVDYIYKYSIVDLHHVEST